jgi:hypothetical protein
VILLLSCVCGGGSCWYTKYKAEQAAEEFQRQMQGLGNMPLDGTGTGDSPVQEPTSGANPTGSGSGSGSGGGIAGVSAEVWATCEKAKSCCRALYSRPVFRNTNAEQACDAIEQSIAMVQQQPESFREQTLRMACGNSLNAFQQAARSVPGGPVAECN